MVLTGLVLLIVFIAVGLPVAVVLFLSSVGLTESFSTLPLQRALGEITWSTNTEFLLVAIPLFIMLGEILLRSGLAEKMYDALSLYINGLPGGLMHTNIISCAIFAATSGSSVATAATVGTVAVEQIEKRGYGQKLFLGTLAAGGTLGIIIPPSINMIIYGALTDTSIPQLFLAGIVPGLMLAALFSGVVVIACLYNKELDGEKIEASWSQKLCALKDLLPPLFIFFLVVGSIYAGWATPTEAASLGVVGAIILTASNGSLSLKLLREASIGTVRTTAMVMLIITAAHFLNFVMTSLGLTQVLTNAVHSIGLSPLTTLLVIVLFYIILGFFMETLSMMIVTIPIITPVIFALGYDPVWFGILLMILLETALITPPIGLNLFVVQSIRQTPGPVSDVIVGSIPFVVAMFVMIGLLIIFPQIALWLPSIVGA